MRRATAAAAALVLITAGCDTGDGKQLQPYDPADYPPPATTIVLDDTLALDDARIVDTRSTPPAAPRRPISDEATPSRSR